MAEHVEYGNVTIETIDTAVHGWLDRTVDSHVEDQNGSRKKVPVLFASGERWAASRTRRAIRDTNGVLILPVLSVRRTGVDINQNMTSLGTEEGNFQVAKRVHKKTNVYKNAALLRTQSLQPMKDATVYEVTTIPFPASCLVTYEMVIHTQYITQMNSIIEKIVSQLDIQNSFVAIMGDGTHQPQANVDFIDRKANSNDPYVVGFFDAGMSSGDNFEEFTDQERIVKYSTSITVPAVLQLNPEGTKPSIQTELTSFDLDFADEQAHFVDDPYELELIFQQRQRG